MFRSNGGFNDALVLTVLILIPVDLANEFDAFQISESADAASILCSWTVVARINATRRIEDGFDESTSHIGPLGTFGAVETNE